MQIMTIPTFQDRLSPLTAESDCPPTMAAITENPVTVAAFNKSGIITMYRLVCKLVVFFVYDQGLRTGGSYPKAYLA